VAGLDEFMPHPEDNPLTAERVAMGRMLFFDPNLSADARTSCASCHIPRHAFADTLAVSRGTHGLTGERNTPSLINRGYGRAFFWDGRAVSLEAQVLEPVTNPLELGLTLHELERRVLADPRYRPYLRADRARGEPVRTVVARGLSSYLRTIRSGSAPFDAWGTGDTSALSVEARRGMALFRGKANCISCHIGPNFTDEEFHNTGVFAVSGDSGRARVTGRTEDVGAFKTPSLREVARTAPYMHDGSVGTLEEVVDFYDRGGRANAALDAEIRPLGLSVEERRALVVFLHALSGRITGH
jgi:cytochrome c peroxidase